MGAHFRTISGWGHATPADSDEEHVPNGETHKIKIDNVNKLVTTWVLLDGSNPISNQQEIGS